MDEMDDCACTNLSYFNDMTFDMIFLGFVLAPILRSIPSQVRRTKQKQSALISFPLQ